MNLFIHYLFIYLFSLLFLYCTYLSRTEFNGTGQINNYTIIREIGKGSFGTVKEALNTEDGKKYAIKVLSKSRLRKSKLKFNVNRGPRAMGAPHPRSSSSGNNEKLECKVEIKVENKTEKVEGYDDLDELKVEIAILKKISKHPYFVRLVEVLSSDQDDHVYMGSFSFFSIFIYISNF